ncbi:MAG: 50S ribosomal protein L25/general stress protein Ctc [Chromatiaceae bacterium]
MSESFEIDARSRADAGKGASRRLRREGLVPAIVYGGHQEPEMISLVHNDLVRHLQHEAFYSHVLDLKVGDNASKVVVKDLQRHPAKPFIQHVDFQRVSADEKIRMLVPLHFLNQDTAKGVKMGGAVSHNVTEVEIACLPKDLPEYIEIDMAEMVIGDIVHLSEIPMPDGVALAHDPDPDLPVVILHGGHAAGPEEGEGGEAAPGGETPASS